MKTPRLFVWVALALVALPLGQWAGKKCNEALNERLFHDLREQQRLDREYLKGFREGLAHRQ